MKGHQEHERHLVAMRITCEACGDDRRVMTIGLPTHGPAPRMWVDGPRVIEGQSLVARCRDGHTISINKDRVLATLKAWADEVGPGGRRVESIAR